MKSPTAGRSRPLWPAQRCRVSHRGQALIEFAVIAPVLIILALGAGDFGRVFSINEAIQNAAREGSRQAAYQLQNTSPAPSSATLAADALAAAQSELGSSGSNLSAATGYSCPASTPPLSASFLQGVTKPSSDHGYLYVCTWTDTGGGSGDSEEHIQVAIYWHMTLWTPIVGVTGVPYLHGIADATGK